MKIVEVDKHSGFCFGVRNAIEKATDLLDQGQKVYCVGDIVHNEEEASRLSHLGMSIIHLDDLEKGTLSEGTVLFRAHGEAPSSYHKVENKGWTLKDATCPVVLKLQQRIKAAYEQMKEQNGQIVIYGKRGHAEVVGLVGQTNGEAIVIEDETELCYIDFTCPIEIFAQTTKSPEILQQLVDAIKAKASNEVKWHNTTCKQVTGRVPRIKAFASRFDAVVFVGGKKSSNAKVLFEACRASNANSYFVSNKSELNPEWFGENTNVIGVCGATSTPDWLMEEIAEILRQY